MISILIISALGTGLIGLSVPRSRCLSIGLFTSVKLGASVSGCRFVEIESSATSHILRCERCGCMSVGLRGEP